MSEDPSERLRQVRSRFEAMGGAHRVERQHAAGKWTARERIAHLLDPGTFQELDRFVVQRGTAFGLSEAELPGDGVVTGFGRLQGRGVFVYAQDFTVFGGSLGEMHARKICKVMDLAMKTGVPVIGLNDSGGARIQEGVDALSGFGEIFRRNTLASGVIPQISVIMGPCAGGAVYSPALTDFVVMVEGTSQMFITGPQVIRTVTGESVTLEALGGARAHAARSGVAALVYPDEASCLEGVRRLVSYLPPNNLEDPPAAEPLPPDDSRAAALPGLIPQQPQRPYDVRDVVLGICDAGSFFELHADFAANVVVGFARLGGRPLGVVANQPRVLAGCLDIDGSDKVARFVRVCDAFNVPLLTLVDTPGYLPGTSQEHGGIIRHGAKVLYAYAEATVPKVSVILRKAYGGAYLAMCSRSLGADLSLALPGAEIAVMGPEGAAEIIFREMIRSDPDPAQARTQATERYRAEFAHPYLAAARGYLDEVVEAADLRAVLITSFAMLASKRDERPPKKHGNFPV